MWVSGYMYLNTGSHGDQNRASDPATKGKNCF